MCRSKTGDLMFLQKSDWFLGVPFWSPPRRRSTQTSIAREGERTTSFHTSLPSGIGDEAPRIDNLMKPFLKPSEIVLTSTRRARWGVCRRVNTRADLQEDVQGPRPVCTPFVVVDRQVTVHKYGVTSACLTVEYLLRVSVL